MNGHETEVKFFVRDLARVGSRLHELGAGMVQPRAHEINIRFDTRDGALRREFKALRLRRDTEAKLTYKGPSKERDGVLKRREIEFTVGNFESAIQFLEALGFEPAAYYEKYRETHELNGAHVMLDELPFGSFVEIEGGDTDTLRSNAAALGLRWDAAVRMGYLTLFERVAEKHSLDAGQLSFNAVKPVQIDENDLGITPADQ
ncbi:MAG: class IV adenylate cyclase [Anaerolineales bacterium]|jgi:adenylate cyclase class 2|nr:class IV adenylate cyclase [Anaerolineales bacterium]MCC6986313.1 class IV adenylate cyclase [Anaerolineales bacterium]